MSLFVGNAHRVIKKIAYDKHPELSVIQLGQA